MKIKTAVFVISNTDYRSCPTPEIPEYAFIGRSNVGKSSLINAFVNQKKLAKISGRPGKTQLINHFVINKEWYLVDLPGFGYAKISKSKRAEFHDMISDYLLNRPNLVCLFILIDCRHKPQLIDQEAGPIIRPSDPLHLAWPGDELRRLLHPRPDLCARPCSLSP